MGYVSVLKAGFMVINVAVFFLNFYYLIKTFEYLCGNRNEVSRRKRKRAKVPLMMVYCIRISSEPFTKLKKKCYS